MISPQVPVALPALDPDGEHHSQAQQCPVCGQELDHRVLPGAPLQAHASYVSECLNELSPVMPWVTPLQQLALGVGSVLC